MVVGSALVLSGCPGPVYRAIPCGILDGDAVEHDVLLESDTSDDNDTFSLDEQADDDMFSAPLFLQWGTSGDETASAVEIAPDGSLFVTGGTTGTLFDNENQGSSDIFLTKITSERTFAWTKQWGTINFDQGLTLTRGNDNTLYVSGLHNGIVDPFTGTGIGHMFIARFSIDGSEQWHRTWGSFDQNYPASASADAHGTIYVTGWAYGSVGSRGNQGLSDIFLSRFNKEGEELWSIQWGSGLIDVGYGVSVASDGGAYLTGWTYGILEGSAGEGRNDAFLTKVTGDGTVRWTRQWGSYGADRSYAIALDEAGNIYLGGSTSGGMGGFSNMGGLDCFLTKFSPEGDIIWFYQWGTSADEEIFAVTLGKDGSIYAVGYTSGAVGGHTPHGKRDILISRLSDEGIPLEHILYGTQADEMALSIHLTSSHLIVAGWTRGDLGTPNVGGSDIFVLFHPLP